MQKKFLIKSLFKKVSSLVMATMIVLLSVTTIINPIYAKKGNDENVKMARVTTSDSSSEGSELEDDGVDFDLLLDIVLGHIDALKQPTPSMFRGLCKGAISWVASRAISELTTLIISSDIDGLSDLLYALQSPATRATIKKNQEIEEIKKTVNAIYESVQKINEQVEYLETLENLNSTEAAYNSAANNLNDVIRIYQSLWSKYEKYSDRLFELTELEEEYPESTRTDSQTKKIEDKKADAELAFDMLIKAFEEAEAAGDVDFLNDLTSLPAYFWNPSAPTQSYLGAYEAYLRQRYTFEHQITDQLYDAVSSCIDINTQILTLYSEYYSYLKNKAEAAGDYETYADYTENYFSNVEYCIVENLNAMVQSTGYGKYAIARELTEDEINAAKEINPNFVKPKQIETTTEINGVTYAAYRVRDNQSLNYFLIIQEPFSIQNIINKYNISKVVSGTHTVYTPTFLIEHQYTDDGQYRLVSSKDEMTFIGNNWTNLRASLRHEDGC